MLRPAFPDSARYRPSFNISPGDEAPVLVLEPAHQVGGEAPWPNAEADARTLRLMRWSLVPCWFGGPAECFQPRTSNCRVESAPDRRSFSAAVLQRQRCAVVCQGYYEARRSSRSGRRMYFVRFPDEPQAAAPRVLLLAGLFDGQETEDERTRSRGPVVSTPLGK
ncbi:abasic site processing protein HMCES-like [Haemaphysalis longicornis]